MNCPGLLLGHSSTGFFTSFGPGSFTKNGDGRLRITLPRRRAQLMTPLHRTDRCEATAAVY